MPEIGYRDAPLLPSSTSWEGGQAFRLPVALTLGCTAVPEVAPVLTVVIPTYNRASLLPRAVRSVLDGTGVPVEVVVVDDGSDDDTEAAVAALTDARVRYVNVPHGGVSAARNVGASMALGRWLAFLDSDDEVLPGWAEAMVCSAEASDGVAVCGGEAVDPTGRALWSWNPPRPTEPLQQAFAEKFLAGMFIIERKAFTEAGGYSQRLQFGENTELALRVLFRTRKRPIVDKRVLVRVHVSPSRDDYAQSRPASAAFVLSEHPWMRHKLPSLWASYHALVGVDEARRREWRSARHHFLAASLARPKPEHLGRLALSAAPVIRTKVWPDLSRPPLQTPR